MMWADRYCWLEDESGSHCLERRSLMCQVLRRDLRPWSPEGWNSIADRGR